MNVQQTEATTLVQVKHPLEKARNRAERTVAKNDSSAAIFEKVLSAFAIGDLSFADLQSSLARLLKAGAAPDELLRVLRWRESIEPLPEEARDKIIELLHDVMPAGLVEGDDFVEGDGARQLRAPAAALADPTQPPADDEPDTSAMLRLIEDFAAAWDTDPKARPPPLASAPVATAPESNGQNVDHKAMRLALGQREDDLAALQAEHSRVLGLLEARARNAAQLQEELRGLSGQFNASRDALETQQGKTREIEEVLAERISAEAAVRARDLQTRNEEAARQADLHQIELRTLRQTLAARDASLQSMRGTVTERDAHIAALQDDHAKLSPALESSAQLVATLQADLAAAKVRIAVLEGEVATTHARATAAAPAAKEEIDAWAGKLQLLQNALDESQTAIEAQRQQHTKVVSALMARAKDTENELKAARARIEAMASELQGRDREAASVRQREQTMPLLPMAKSPAPGLQLRRGVEISDFSAPPPRPPARAQTWKPRSLAGTVGICATIAVLAVILWATMHHAPASAKVPEVAAVLLPAPGTVIRDCTACPSFTVLPAGRFKQGSADSNASMTVKPLHWVAISQPFAMSTNAVTVDQFRAFASATNRDMQGCDIYNGRWKYQPKNNWQNPGFEQDGTYPVTCASWSDATAYAQWLTHLTGHHYRLPSASEWEYAARAGSEAVQPWNANGSDACANANVADLSAAHRYPGWVAFACNDGFVFTAPVGSFKASAFGLNDMLGNVFQWTEDCWSVSYKGAPIDGSARADGNCSEHELRGGSWFSSPGYVRADYRNHFAANYRASSAGIRLARDITP